MNGMLMICAASFTVQLFYAWRIWRLSSSHLLVALVIFVRTYNDPGSTLSLRALPQLALASAGAGIAFVIIIATKVSGLGDLQGKTILIQAVRDMKYLCFT
jgi:hypothetical protein